MTGKFAMKDWSLRVLDEAASLSLKVAETALFEHYTCPFREKSLKQYQIQMESDLS